MSLQMHVISGFVGTAPETREVTTPNGIQTVTTMSVAVNNPRKRDADPTWYRITMWNGLGNTVAQYVGKGDFVVVQGDRLAISTWIDQQGNPRATLELTASGVDFSGNRRGNGQADAGQEDGEFAPPPENVTDIPF